MINDNVVFDIMFIYSTFYFKFLLNVIMTPVLLISVLHISLNLVWIN